MEISEIGNVNVCRRLEIFHKSKYNIKMYRLKYIYIQLFRKQNEKSFNNEIREAGEIYVLCYGLYIILNNENTGIVQKFTNSCKIDTLIQSQIKLKIGKHKQSLCNKRTSILLCTIFSHCKYQRK